MASEFHIMLIRHMISDGKSYTVNINMPESSDGEKVVLEDHGGGQFTLSLSQPHCPERHMALGRFMDEWSKLEIALGSLLSRALKLGSGQLPALANSLGTRGILDVLSVQMTRKLPGANVELAQKLLDRVKEKNTQRNYLTHGFWILEWNIVDQGGRPAAIPRVYRGYTPTDPDVAERLKDPRNRKERLRFMFTVKRIDALSLSVGALCLDISRFANRHFNQSKPLKQDVNLPVTDNVFGTAITKPFTNSTP